MGIGMEGMGRVFLLLEGGACQTAFECRRIVAFWELLNDFFISVFVLGWLNLTWKSVYLFSWLVIYQIRLRGP